MLSQKNVADLHKLFNGYTFKVSYSSLPKNIRENIPALSNFKTVINLHNKNALNKQEELSPCNCREKTSCLFKVSFQHKNLLYSCKVSTPDLKQNHPHYIGLKEHTLKDRLYKHYISFKYESKRNSIELPNFIWAKKKEKINVDLDWSILDKAKHALLFPKNPCYALQKNITSFSLQRIY